MQDITASWPIGTVECPVECSCPQSARKNRSTTPRCVFPLELACKIIPAPVAPMEVLGCLKFGWLKIAMVSASVWSFDYSFRIGSAKSYAKLNFTFVKMGAHKMMHPELPDVKGAGSGNAEGPDYCPVAA